MKGVGVAYGATTVVNAMPSGLGASLGVDLWTVAEVELNDHVGISVEINGDSGESKELAKESFKVVMERFGLRKGGSIKTWSNIPIARGMKSSSAASNAIVLATLDALGEDLEDLEIVKLGVEASIRARVTLTGAFDDASASYFGGLQITDNCRMRILKSVEVEPLTVLFLVPEERRYSGSVGQETVRSVRRLAEVAFQEAMGGRVWQAMILNGLIMSHTFGYDPSPIITAMERGAISAGLCGKGPAVCAVCREGDEDPIVEGWKRFGARIIKAKTSCRKARKGEDL
ncbi:MAG: shikimate kinase [Candidatus Methanomethyliales bacterium]|nr:shikimate kinase [Candidatus Methanomethylicales archaeon]